MSAASASSAEDGVRTATTVQRSSGNVGKDHTHRVRRLRWQARAPDAAAAFALQRLLHRHAEAVSMALDEALARIADTALSPGQVWHLPALTLRLDAGSLAQLDADLPGLIAQGLHDALHDALPNGLPNGLINERQAALQPTPDPVSHASVPAAAALPAAAPGRLSTPAQADLAALLTYLATGSLPWALAGLSTEAQQHCLQAAAGAALETLLGMDSARRATALAELLAPATAPASRIGALLRWLPLLDPAQKQRWLAQTPPPAGIAPALAQAWFALLADAATALEWTALWLVWPTLTAAPLGAAVAGGGRAALAQPDADAVSRWIAGLPAGSTDVRLPAAASLAEPGVKDHRLATALLRSLGAAPAGSEAAALPTPPAARRAAEPSQASAAAVDAQLVALAGLVLLHPYLPRFLGGCGLLDSAGRAIPDALLPRACAVLHALACGEAGMALAEHQLPLIKLLLGRAPDQPLSAALPRPDASDLAEIDSLLAAVCSHWKALGKTSAAGLRLSFLQRRGLLRPADGAWQLNMQGESFDMLLDLLPWAISLVKLPWMARPLMVEWRAGAP